MPVSHHLMIEFDNTYIELPDNFYARCSPAKVSKPKLITFNQELARNELGIQLDALSENDLAEIFSGKRILAGAEPIALAYAGHQFGHFAPQLGDGRALLLGEIIAPDGRRFDIQLKGSGPTPFSRNGDGRSALGPVIREYLVSEAMHHLGVPTTRALAAVTTGDWVYRETKLPGGIFTRVASSHIRIGTFEYLAARGDKKGVKRLADYVIARHYPEIQKSENIYLRLLESVANAQALLVAHWMSLGFIHGVMNTDNMSVSGETLDYGPCAFMDNFSFDRVFSSIDRNSRYAYGNQINIAKWNLFRLADCLLPLVSSDQEKAVRMMGDSIAGYTAIYKEKWLEKMKPKLGLAAGDEADEALINQWLQYLEDQDLDFTLSFRALNNAPNYFEQTPQFKAFYKNWQQRLNGQTYNQQHIDRLMNSVNPVYIPRNHWVERAIEKAVQGDYSVFKAMNECLKSPYQEQPKFSAYKKPPIESERIAATFCGT